MDLLTWLEDWYARRCDGEWEHRHGIRLESLDNPGWWLRVSLTGTPLAGRPFAPVARRNPADARDWLDCRVRDDTFEGAGGPHHLATILALFRAWAEGDDAPATEAP